MSTMGALVVAVAAALLGGACAAADGALLALDDEPPPGGEDGGERMAARERSHHALSTARVVMQLATGAAAASVLRLWRWPAPLAVLSALALAVAASLLIEVGPRAVGAAYGARAIRVLRPIVAAAEMLFGPLAAAAAALDAAAQRLLPPAAHADAELAATAEQFRQPVPAGAAGGGDRRALFRRLFALGQTEVQDVMMPRVDITGIEKHTPWSEVLDRVRSSEHARLPVYDGTIDDIVGILLAKDLLQAAVAGEPPAGGWLGLVRPASFIPESKTIEHQLRDFKAEDAHLAIVVDEYGGTAGLVTIEDVLEEIVGDIRDEHDSEEPSIESEGDGRFWVAGRVSLDELSDALRHPFERADVTTVGGLIYDLLGRVPCAGEELAIDGFRVVVERVVRRRVERVYFERAEVLAEDAT